MAYDSAIVDAVSQSPIKPPTLLCTLGFAATGPVAKDLFTALLWDLPTRPPAMQDSWVHKTAPVA